MNRFSLNNGWLTSSEVFSNGTGKDCIASYESDFINLLFEDKDFAEKVLPILTPNYFQSGVWANVVWLVVGFYEENGFMPGKEHIDVLAENKWGRDSIEFEEVHHFLFSSDYLCIGTALDEDRVRQVKATFDLFYLEKDRLCALAQMAQISDQTGLSTIQRVEKMIEVLADLQNSLEIVQEMKKWGKIRDNNPKSYDLS